MTKKQAVQPQDKYVLRLPDGLRDRIKEAAEKNGRSMNAEMIARLEAGQGGDVAALKRQIQDEHAAFVRLEGIFDSQMDLIEDYRRVIKMATDQGINQAGIIQSLCTIIKSLEGAPSDEILDLADRLFSAAVATKEDLADSAERRKKRT